jgi:amino acid permease
VIEIYKWTGLDNFRNGMAFVGGMSAFVRTFVNAFYSFGGAELVALAAGECEKPYRSFFTSSFLS